MVMHTRRPEARRGRKRCSVVAGSELRLPENVFRFNDAKEENRGRPSSSQSDSSCSFTCDFRRKSDGVLERDIDVF